MPQQGLIDEQVPTGCDCNNANSALAHAPISADH